MISPVRSLALRLLVDDDDDDGLLFEIAVEETDDLLVFETVNDVCDWECASFGGLVLSLFVDDDDGQQNRAFVILVPNE